MYDSASVMERKNPMGVIEAFKKAFPIENSSVGLVIKMKQYSKSEIQKIKEALKGVINRMFTDGFTKIQAEHHIENPASGNVMKKCGMKFVKYRKAQRKFGSDELCETKLYEITK